MYFACKAPKVQEHKYGKEPLSIFRPPEFWGIRARSVGTPSNFTDVVLQWKYLRLFTYPTVKIRLQFPYFRCTFWLTEMVKCVEWNAHWTRKRWPTIRWYKIPHCVFRYILKTLLYNAYSLFFEISAVTNLYRACSKCYLQRIAPHRWPCQMSILFGLPRHLCELN